MSRKQRRKRELLVHTERFAEAVALGQIADIEFVEECGRCGIPVPRSHASASPLDVLEKLERPAIIGRMDA